MLLVQYLDQLGEEAGGSKCKFFLSYLMSSRPPSKKGRKSGREGGREGGRQERLKSNEEKRKKEETKNKNGGYDDKILFKGFFSPMLV